MFKPSSRWWRSLCTARHFGSPPIYMVGHRVLVLCMVLTGSGIIDCHHLWRSLVRLIFPISHNWCLSMTVPRLPLGLFVFPLMALSGVLRQKFEAKHKYPPRRFSAMVTRIVFFPSADDTTCYWPIAFPGFILGTVGTTLVFVTTKCQRTTLACVVQESRRRV